jgi:hypothetical protein
MTYNDIRFEITHVTPESAKRMLERMTPQQRNIRRHSVISHKQDLLAGTFVLTPDPIVRGTSGLYLNGQHRLTAIVETGVPAWLVIASGFDDSVYEVMDSGMKRSLVDRVSTTWLKDVRAIAMVRLCYLGSAVTNLRVADSERVVLAAAIEGEEWFEPIAERFKNTKHVKYGWFLAALARGFMNGISLDVISRFVAVHQDPAISEGSHESAAVALRLYFEKNGTTGGGQGANARADNFRRVMNALSAFASGGSRTLSKSTAVDVFPLAAKIERAVARARGIEAESHEVAA